MIDENEEIMIANGYKESLNIKAPSIEQIVGNLSGGNQQKFLGKMVICKAKYSNTDEPTWY